MVSSCRYPLAASACPSGGPIAAWGSETQIRSRGESVVLVDQAAEQILSADVSRAHSHRGLVFRRRCCEGESAMGPPAVVMLGIRPERPIEMPPTQDQRPIGALGPDGLDDPFGVGVGVGGPNGSWDHFCSLRAEDLVEGRDELPVSYTHLRAHETV